MPLESLGVVSYPPSIETMAVSIDVCEIFSVKEWCDLENRVRVRCSVVPRQWKSSCINPLPKAISPATCQDYRPISNTSISRVMEKSLVKSVLYPVLTYPDYSQLFSDQFGFRPTGSTTAALIYLFHQVSSLLQDHDYVHWTRFI